MLLGWGTLTLAVWSIGYFSKWYASDISTLASLLFSSWWSAALISWFVIIYPPQAQDGGASGYQPDEARSYLRKSGAWWYNNLTGWYMLTFLLFTIAYYVAVQIPGLMSAQESMANTAIFFAIAGASALICFVEKTDPRTGKAERPHAAIAWSTIIIATIVLWIAPPLSKGGGGVTSLSLTAMGALSGVSVGLFVVALVILFCFMGPIFHAATHEIVIPASRRISINMCLVMTSDFLFHEFSDWLQGTADNYTYLLGVAGILTIVQVFPYEYAILPILTRIDCSRGCCKEPVKAFKTAKKAAQAARSKRPPPPLPARPARPSLAALAQATGGPHHAYHIASQTEEEEEEDTETEEEEDTDEEEMINAYCRQCEAYGHTDHDHPPSKKENPRLKVKP